MELARQAHATFDQARETSRSISLFQERERRERWNNVMPYGTQCEAGAQLQVLGSHFSLL